MKSRRTPAVSPLPVWAGGLGALALCFLVLPLAFMLGRVNWATLGATLATDEASAALALSLRTCVMALGVDLLLGVPAALLLSRSWRGVRAARILVALPLSLPPVVAGIALLAAFGRRSTLGALLSGAGLDIAFTTTAVVIAQVFVSLPFLIVTLESALRSREQGLEEMASSLGASPSRVFWQITLPTVLPGLGRGAALALARCLGEFGATLTFAGSMQGVTRTMPLQIYLPASPTRTWPSRSASSSSGSRRSSSRSRKPRGGTSPLSCARACHRRGRGAVLRPRLPRVLAPGDRRRLIPDAAAVRRMTMVRASRALPSTLPGP